jgi:hypothetical protein
MKRAKRNSAWSATVFCATALLVMSGGVAGHATEQEEQPPQQQSGRTAAEDSGQAQEQSPRASRRALSRITGTVLRWTGNRIDLKTPEGKTQKVAVNRDTERLVEIEQGAEVAIEYRREISDFIIAERVLPAGVEDEAVPSNTAQAKAPGMVTGSIVNWSDAALVLKTDAGDVTLFLSPSTEYLVAALEPGLPVTVEYQEDSNQARLAVRVRAAGEASLADQPPGDGSP